MADEIDSILAPYFPLKRSLEVDPYRVETTPAKGEIKAPPARLGDRFAQPLAESLSPTMGAYEAGKLLAEVYGQARARDWDGLAGNSPFVLGAVAPIPGVRGKRLGMSPAAKEARATEMGHLPDTYHHGTTHKFKSFEDPKDPGSPYETESYHGRAIYMSSSPSDARSNYAGMGPDLTNRIERVAGQREMDMKELPDKERKALAKRAKALSDAGVMPDYYARDHERPASLAWAQAYDELTGRGARMLDLRTNPQNPVYVGGPKDTFFGYDLPDYAVRKDGPDYVVVDPAGDPVYKGRFPDEAAAHDHADSLRYESEPVGPGTQLVEAIEDLRWRPGMSGRAIDELLGSLQSRLMDYQGIKASEFEKMVREGDFAAYLIDEQGPGQFLADTYQKMGHDAAILANAERQFPRMGIPPDTTHIALYDPRRARSVDAKFDPAKKDSTDLMAGLATATAVPGIVLQQAYGNERAVGGRAGYAAGGAPAGPPVPPALQAKDSTAKMLVSEFGGYPMVLQEALYRDLMTPNRKDGGKIDEDAIKATYTDAELGYGRQPIDPDYAEWRKAAVDEAYGSDLGYVEIMDAMHALANYRPGSRMMRRFEDRRLDSEDDQERDKTIAETTPPDWRQPTYAWNYGPLPGPELPAAPEKRMGMMDYLRLLYGR